MKIKNIAWIGTGVMGQSMCGHLLVAGYNVFVANRTREKAAGLIEKGAHWCDTPAAAVAQADIVFTIVGYPRDVESVYIGASGIVATAERSIAALDAPVSGGVVVY